MAIWGSTPAELARAAELLRHGGLVAFPTETVYGLGADARNPKAVGRIFTVKGRPPGHPLIVHLFGLDQLGDWALDPPPAAFALAERFWPGPLTLILRRAPGVPDAVTGGQDTVGLRVPAHPVAAALLRAFGSGIAAPSANRFGRVSPTTAAHVADELGDAVDCIIDGGPCRIGVESTILDLSGVAPRLLRPGGVGGAALAEVLGAPPEVAGADAPRASGTLPAHYAPATALRLAAPDALPAVVRAHLERGERVAVLAYRPRAELPAGCHWEPIPADPAGYAHDLYARLRALDALGLDWILVEAPPETPDWEAVRDRLRRAAWAWSGTADDAP